MNAQTQTTVNTQQTEQKKGFWHGVRTIATGSYNGAKLFLTWRWFTRLMWWAILSAGEVAEGVFLIGTVWLCANATVHPLVLKLMSEEDTQTLTYIVVALFVILPELILCTSIIRSFKLGKLFFYKKGWIPFIWWMVFLLPTLVFLILSFYTAGNSVAALSAHFADILAGKHINASAFNFELPTPFVVLRALSGLFFSIASLVWAKLGEPHYVDELQNKDVIITELKENTLTIQSELQQEKESIVSELRSENAAIREELSQQYQQKENVLLAEINTIQSKFDELYSQLQATIRDKNEMNTALLVASKSALQAWPQEVIEWLNALNTTVHIDEIVSRTGINKPTLKKALERKELTIKGRNNELIWVPSVREYLEKHAPKNKNTAQDTTTIATNKERDTGPILKLVGD
jgi:hypothetical protein